MRTKDLSEVETVSSLVAQIAEGCRHARAAVVLQKNARGMSARSPEGQAARAERLRRDASKVLQALIRMRFAKRRAAIRRESIRREIRRRERRAATSLQSVVRVAQAKCLAKMLRYLKKDAAGQGGLPSRWRRCATGSGGPLN